MAEVFVNDLVLHTGTDFIVTFILEDSISNSLKNLSDYNACAQLRRYETSSKTKDFTVSFTQDRSNGRLTVSMGSTDTSQLKAGKYFYDVVLQDPQGIKERVVEGTVLVKKSITR
jgi:hypothetical protein|tara:strand:+ start:693 stop:1037 length:345 start_codon:yes stop_codon:yes gene_type:complete